VLQRLKRLPASLLRALGRLGKRATKLALLATAVTGLFIVLDAIFLDDDGDPDRL
jgi:hypothetical protein